MPLTFIDLCNKTLRRLNEVEISQADFPSARGVQALVKDAVRASLASINQMAFEWPFNAAEDTVVLNVGQTEYTFPVTLKSVDWASFQIVPNGVDSVDNTRLSFIERDVWYEKYRDADDDASIDGIGVPEYCFPAHGLGFGVTPAPDKAYRVQFRYFRNYEDLQNASDTTRMPYDFENAIVTGALYHMYMFKDNPESAGVAYETFMQLLKNLRTIYINTYENVRDHRVNFGGGRNYRLVG